MSYRFKFFRKRRVLFFNLFIIGIFVVAFFLRAQEFLSNNYLFLMDQGRDMMAVKKIVFDLKPTLIGPYTSLQGVFQGPLWFYLLAIPTFVTQGDPRGGVFLMLIFSMIVVLVSFYWVKKEFGVITGFTTALLFSFSPEAIAAATYTWNPHPMWLLTLFFIVVFYYIFTASRTKLIPLLWLLVGLMFHFETAFGVFITIGFVIYFFFFLRKYFFSRINLIGFVVFIFAFFPQILFDVRHDFLMTKSILGILVGENKGLLVKGESSNYLFLLQNHLNEFWGNFLSSFVQDGALRVLPIIIFFMSWYFLFYTLRYKLFSIKERKFVSSIVIFWVIIVCLYTFFYPFPLRYWFLTGFQTFYLIFLGIVFGIAWRKRFGVVLISVLFGVMIIYCFIRIYYLYISPPNDGGTAKIKGKISAVDFIYKDAGNKEFGLLVFTPPVNTDAYDYLFFWHGMRQYKYIPHFKKDGQVYLLIEPDLGQMWTYNGWLETVVKDGEVLKTWNMPSGFIIQKRRFE